MAISTEIVGKTFGPFVRDYTFKDLEICALGCGAGWDGRVDLDYVNEGDAKNPELKVLPIFAVPLTVNEEMTTITVSITPDRCITALTFIFMRHSRWPITLRPM